MSHQALPGDEQPAHGRGAEARDAAAEAAPSRWPRAGPCRRHGLPGSPTHHVSSPEPGEVARKNDKVFVAGSRGQALPILHISLHLNPYEALIYFSHLTVPVTP